MTTTTPIWTENQILRTSATLAASGTSTHDIDLATNGFDTVSIQINITIGSSSGVTVEFFASPDSGTTDDDVSLPGKFTTAASVKKTIIIMAVPYIQMKLTNDDGSNATGNIAALYAGRKWDTT